MTGAAAPAPSTRRRCVLGWADGSWLGCWGAYVLCFCVLFLAFSMGLLLRLKGFVWVVDGLEQQYPFFVMEGQWLRELAGNLLVRHVPELPQWTDAVGYGADYLVSLSNTLGNPINLISAFVPARWADVALNLTVPITMGLAGTTFLWWCRQAGSDRLAALVAALAYAFGGYASIAFSQIFLLYPLVLGPLVLRGVDRVFERESPAAFVVAMALCFLDGVSTAYVACLALVPYCLMRFIALPDRGGVASFLRWLFGILSCVVLGALVAGVLLLPVTASLAGQGRLGLDRPAEALYQPSYYLSLVTSFLGSSTVGQDCFAGIPPIAVVSVALLPRLRDRDGRRICAVMLAILLAWLCLPMLGRISNGLAYPNNRWSWIWALACAATVARALPACWERGEGAGAPMSSVPLVALLAVAAAIPAVGWATGLVGDPLTATMVGGNSLLLAAAGIVLLGRGRRLGRRACAAVALATVCLGTCLTYVPIGLGFGNLVPPSRAWLWGVSSTPAPLIAAQPGHEGWRWDTAGLRQLRNANVPAGLLGTTFYNSMYNGYIDEYHTSLGLVSSSMNFSWEGLDDRPSLEALAGTRYLAAPAGNAMMVPGTYRGPVATGPTGGGPVELYETDHLLPEAFVYEGAVARSSYDAMGLVERGDAMLGAAVLEDDDAPVARRAPSQGTALSSVRELPSELTASAPGGDACGASEGAQPASVAPDGTVTVTQPGQVLYLDCDIPAGALASLEVRNLSYEGDPSATDTKVFVSCAGMRQEIWSPLPSSHLYGGKHDWVVNLGTSAQARRGVALTFRDAGTYSIGSLRVVTEDASALASDIDKLAARGATTVSSSANERVYDAHADGDGELLYMRIPFGAGWSATIDGAPAPLLRANVGFMAVRLPAGDHEVRLAYETPLLRAGAACTVAGVAATSALHRRWRHRASRQAA